MSNNDTSNCVTSIIHAFTNGLDIFKRLRERRRRKKSRKGNGHAKTDVGSGDELQLSNSLRRGPVDIRTKYDRNYSIAGDRFAKGDAIAHASLAETLIKLNTGLVGIIAAFLNHDTKDKLHLDYKSLTNLSDASRAETMIAMDQLYQRLSQSAIVLSQMRTGCPRCGSSKHANCSAIGSTQTDRKGNGGKKQKSGKSSARSGSSTPTVTRVPIKSSSQTQLAVVRPRNRRKTSSSSSSSSTASTKSQSSAAVLSAYASPPSPPLPAYSPIDPYPPVPSKTGAFKSTPTPRRRSGSMSEQRPQTWPHVKPDPSAIPSPPIPPKIPLSRKSPPPIREKPIPSPMTPKLTGSGPTPFPRRADKLTPSVYTFASDSTKLGEIPMRNWTKPFDFEEAERLNVDALVNGWVPGIPEPKEKPKRKLFGFLRRSDGGASGSAT